jgi:geranylgeranyl pyrophosphate synthase
MVCPLTNDGSKVMEAVALLRRRGQESFGIAKQTMLEEKNLYEPLREALSYFVEEVFPDIMHPGLLSIYCEAIGGNIHETIEVGAALVLLVAAADLHDDIVDQSTVKNGKLTVLGKYGEQITVLAGDAFLIEGMHMLHNATANFSDRKRNEIFALIKQAFYDLSSVEAEEASLRGNDHLSGYGYFDLIKRKTAVSEATAKIGAVLGNGTADQVETLGRIGHIFGLLSMMRDEFIDVFEPAELFNRYSKEILPLPIMYVFQDPEKKSEIVNLLKGGKMTKRKIKKIVDIVMQSQEIKKLKEEMRLLVEEAQGLVSELGRGTDSLSSLIGPMTENLA